MPKKGEKMFKINISIFVFGLLMIFAAKITFAAAVYGKSSRIYLAHYCESDLNENETYGNVICRVTSAYAKDDAIRNCTAAGYSVNRCQAANFFESYRSGPFFVEDRGCKCEVSGFLNIN